VAIGGLCLGYGVAKDTLLPIINSCIDLGLFVVDEENENLFTSMRVQEHLSFRQKAITNGIQGAKVRWKKSKNSHPNSHPIRDPNSKTDRQTDRDKELNKEFDLLYIEYGSHGVKSKGMKYWKLLNESDKALVKQNIPKYLAYLVTEPWRKKKNFEGWINPKNRLFEAEYDTGEKPYTPLSQEYIDRLEDECDQDEYKTIGEHVKALEAKGEFDND